MKSLWKANHMLESYCWDKNNLGEEKDIKM